MAPSSTSSAKRPRRRARLELLFDPGTFRPVRAAVGDGVLSGSGSVNGRPVYAWAQDGGFKGGSLGERGGETIARTIDHAESSACRSSASRTRAAPGCRRASARCIATRGSSARRRSPACRRSA